MYKRTIIFLTTAILLSSNILGMEEKPGNPSPMVSLKQEGRGDDSEDSPPISLERLERTRLESYSFARSAICPEPHTNILILCEAAMCNKGDMKRFMDLLDTHRGGLNVNALVAGRTLLQASVYHGRGSFTRILLNTYKADPRAKDEKGDNLVPYLLKRGLRYIGIGNDVSCHFNQYIKPLLSEPVDALGRTAIFYAIDDNRPDDVGIILEHNSGCVDEKYCGMTPLQYAIARGFTELAVEIAKKTPERIEDAIVQADTEWWPRRGRHFHDIRHLANPYSRQFMNGSPIAQSPLTRLTRMPSSLLVTRSSMQPAVVPPVSGSTASGNPEFVVPENPIDSVRKKPRRSLRVDLPESTPQVPEPVEAPAALPPEERDAKEALLSLRKAGIEFLDHKESPNSGG